MLREWESTKMSSKVRTGSYVSIIAGLMIGTLAGASSSCSSRSSHWEGGQKPTLTLTASPKVGAVPLTVQFVATVRGGSDTEPLLYCADAEWDYGNATHVERLDCPPLEDGGVTIQRTYSSVHTYKNPGNYKVQLKLLHGEDSVMVAKTKVKAAEPGARFIH